MALNRKMMAVWLIPYLAVPILLTSCMSPLDSGSPRKEIPLTPAPKVLPEVLEYEMQNEYGQYRIVGNPVIELDTSTVPMAVWIDATLEAFNMGDPEPVLRRFRIRADSLLTSGYNDKATDGRIELELQPEDQLQPLVSVRPDGVVHQAYILPAESPRELGTPREVTISIFIYINKTPTPLFGNRIERLVGQIFVRL